MWRQQDMPAAAGEAERSEAPLICFTVFAPAAAGASLFALPLGGGRALAAIVVLMVTTGMLASVAHLARPLRAPRSLTHLGSSWLSREILAVSAFWALAALWLVCELGGALALGGAVGAASAGGAAGEPVAGAPAAGGGAAGGAAATVFPWAAAARGFHVAAIVVGAVLLWVIARAYRVHGQPAWDGSDTFWELVAGALGSGGAVAAAVAAGQGIAGFGGTLPLMLLGVVALIGLASSSALIRFASGRRMRRVGELADRERTPRALAARDTLTAGEPRLYRRFNAIAIAFALAALCVGLLPLLGGLTAIATSIALAFSALSELVAQASLRNRFYSLAQHARFAAIARR